MYYSSDQQAAQIMDSFMISGSQNQNDNSVEYFRKAKEEMRRLGFSSYEEYMDYLEFIKIKSRRTEKTLNVGQVE